MDDLVRFLNKIVRDPVLLRSKTSSQMDIHPYHSPDVSKWPDEFVDGPLTIRLKAFLAAEEGSWNS